MQRFLLLAMFGLIAQLVDGSLGMAYGVTSSTLLLAAGIAPAAASASVHLAEVGTTLMSGVSHYKMGNTDWRTVRWLAFPGAVGAFSGAVLLTNLNGDMIKPLIAGFLTLLGVYVLIRFAVLGGKISVRAGSISGKFLLPLGLFAGFLDAIGGGGWGPISTPTLLASGRMEPRKVVGTVDTSEILVAGAASIGFLLAMSRSLIHWEIVAAILVGGVIAAPIAAWLVRFLHPRVLGSAVGGLIVLTNVRTLLGVLELDSAVANQVLAAIAVVWIAAIAWSARAALAERRNAQTAPAPELSLSGAGD